MFLSIISKSFDVRKLVRESRPNMLIINSGLGNILICPGISFPSHFNTLPDLKTSNISPKKMPVPTNDAFSSNFLFANQFFLLTPISQRYLRKTPRISEKNAPTATQKVVRRYMAERPLAGWAYWPLNGHLVCEFSGR